ncbi:hypothetical protein GALMADRAFT_280165 [Galerina marginata CBS 339.88]|uniref:DUF6534 domain-containing protein n=1 Tax=Galerina marginata (strain CBS 339.88) TaxID=685588 RepID=A0A067SV64_GALM3|nr:hypothetical protein GALMADRAFT_280165 [Galerina marginata CBS 339.88]
MVSPTHDIHTTLGALLVGLLASCCLFGISTTQAYIYFSHFHKDRFYLKTLVVLVWSWELAHYVCLFYSFYFFAVVGYGNPNFLLNAPTAFNVAIGISGVISTLVQTFFADRIRVLSEKLFIPVVCWTLSLVRLGTAFLTMSEAIKTPAVIPFAVEWKWLVVLTLAVGLAVDVTIAVSLSYYLKTKNKKLNPRTSFVVDRVTRWTIETGLLTSLTALAVLICYVTMPRNFIWLGFYQVMARVYSNSLLASLNGRRILRKSAEPDFNSGYSRITRFGDGSTEISVHVSTMTEVKFDPVFEYGVV